MTADEYRKMYCSLKSILTYIENHEKILLDPFNLTSTRFAILWQVHAQPGINYIDLSDRILCTKGNTTRMIASMMENGLIIRKENPEDRRSYQLFLSENGIALFEEVNRAYIERIKCLIGSFDDDQLKFYADVSHDIEEKFATAKC